MPLHEEGGALLGEQPPVPHDAHSVRLPGLLDIVRRDDHAHAWQVYTCTGLRSLLNPIKDQKYYILIINYILAYKYFFSSKYIYISAIKIHFGLALYNIGMFIASIMYKVKVSTCEC